MYLAELLIKVKLANGRVRRAKVLGGPAYDQLSDSVCELYRWLEERSIDDIERCCWTPRKGKAIAPK